jgi:hypothetical protein
VKSNDDIGEVWPKVSDYLTFDSVQSVFQNWRSRLAEVIEHGGWYIWVVNIESQSQSLAQPGANNNRNRQTSSKLRKKTKETSSWQSSDVR